MQVSRDFFLMAEKISAHLKTKTPKVAKSIVFCILLEEGDGNESTSVGKQ